MKTHNVQSLAPFVLLALALLMAGCAGSPPSRFYTLSSTAERQPDGVIAQTEIKHLISIGPIEIADYLDRPQIVTRTSENRVQFSEFERWGGSVKSEISRVLVENISALLGKDGVTAIPWRSTYRAVFISVPVTIYRLDAMPGGTLSFEATWGILSSDGKTVETMRDAAFTLPLSGTDYEAIVQTISSAMGKLSSDMVPAIRAALAKRPLVTSTEPPKKD
jgi:uncharacterized protein